MIQRQWMVTSDNASALWNPSAKKIQVQGTGLEAAGILGALGGIMLLALAVESLPVALIARYAFGATWGKSIALGVASAVGYNLLTGTFSKKTAPRLEQTGALAQAAVAQAGAQAGALYGS